MEEYFIITDYDKEIVSFDALWYSFMKCKKGVGWKPGVMSYNLNAPEKVYKMAKKFEKGNWKNSKPREIKITYPKPRDGLSIPFEDRIYQRSINDMILYPSATKSFIYGNCACQKSKGTDFARKLCDKYLHREYINHGLDFYVLQIDVHGYYPNMRHDEVKKIFAKCLNEVDHKMVCAVLDTQYAGDIGYNPGSQMVQIAGISVLNPIDHYIKEQLRIKSYLRYMDDFLIFHHNLDYLEDCLVNIKTKLKEIGFEAHPKKTHIMSIRKGFTFLGFEYRLTNTGKIIKTLNSENVHHERKKLRREVNLYRKGKMSLDKIYEGFNSWCENASHGNSYKVINRTKKYLKELIEDGN